MLYILIFLLLTLTALGKDCPCKSETHKNEFNKAEVGKIKCMYLIYTHVFSCSRESSELAI